MKKLISILLALTLVLSLSVAAFAAGTGSITLNSVSKGTEYTIYRLLDLESYDVAAGAYAYKVNSAWAAFFADDAGGKPYIKYDETGNYVQWAAGEDAATVAAFAQLALAYAEAHGIPAVAEHDVPDDADYTSYKFEGLDLGWYLVDSNAGALCGLTTTNPDASVNAKNGTPTVDKQVKEDLGGTWGGSNTADIGQIVEFRTTIHVAAGAENYVLHDSMTAGLTFEQDLTEGRGVTEIKHINSLGVETTLTLGTEYTVESTGCTDGCDFEVVFKEDFVKTLKANDRIHVYYNALLNRDAVIAGTGNINESYLEYGEDHFTTHDSTQTYTFSIDIIKTDASNKLIDGAKFKVYDAPTGGNEVRVIFLKLDADGKTKIYRRARADELTGDTIEVVNGKAIVLGFDNGNYYLEETEAPDGYNKLSARQKFIISDGNLDATFNGEIYSTGSGVHVVNKTGSMLPETGGLGTLIFTGVGVTLVLITGVVLVTKKRMSKIVD